MKHVNPRRVVVLNDFSVAHGGAESIALLAVKLLRQRGIAVTFIAGDDGDNPLFAEEHVPIVAMGGRRLLDASSRLPALYGLYNRRTTSIVSDWIRRNDTFDTVYHLHTWSKYCRLPYSARFIRCASGRSLRRMISFLSAPMGLTRCSSEVKFAP